jgi:hypothetical protein
MKHDSFSCFPARVFKKNCCGCQILFQFPSVIENSVKGAVRNLELKFWWRICFIVICSAVLIVQLSKCLAVGCTAVTLQRIRYCIFIQLCKGVAFSWVSISHAGSDAYPLEHYLRMIVKYMYQINFIPWSDQSGGKTACCIPVKHGL